LPWTWGLAHRTDRSAAVVIGGVFAALRVRAGIGRECRTMRRSEPGLSLLCCFHSTGQRCRVAGLGVMPMHPSLACDIGCVLSDCTENELVLGLSSGSGYDHRRRLSPRFEREFCVCVFGSGGVRYGRGVSAFGASCPGPAAPVKRHNQSAQRMSVKHLSCTFNREPTAAHRWPWRSVTGACWH